MGWKGIGLRKDKLAFWQIYYFLKYRILFYDIVDLGNYLESLSHDPTRSSSDYDEEI